MSEDNLINPIPELIGDDTYSLLHLQGVLSETGIRNYVIRKKFKEFRSQKLSASDAIDKITQEFGYLQFDSVRKIVYGAIIK